MEEKLISPKDAVASISNTRGSAIVVSTMTANRYWDQVSVHRELDLPVFGGMGKASSIGLGLAIALSDRKVFVLDGDGSLLMNLGSLVTISDAKPENLIHFVFEDEVYFTTGSQAIPNSSNFSFKEMALAAGYNKAFEFSDYEIFDNELENVLKERGPILVCLKVSHPEDVPDDYKESTSERMRVLMHTLNLKVEDGCFEK